MAADSSTSAQKRRATKPLIEKRRRARINSSLAQLKEIVAKPSSNTQENRSNRLEKADILEMTVEYVKRIHGKKDSAEATSPDSAVSSDHENHFREGYRLCMTEVQNFFYKNYRKQASKQFLSRSLQTYLQQIFRRTLTAERPCCPDRYIPNTSRCGCKNERFSGDVEKSRKNEKKDEFHSENSNFGSSYSSTSTDDEMAENFSTPEYEVNNQLKESMTLSDSILQRSVSHLSGNIDKHTNDRMWRPW